MLTALNYTKIIKSRHQANLRKIGKQGKTRQYKFNQYNVEVLKPTLVKKDDFYLKNPLFLKPWPNSSAPTPLAFS